MSSMGRGIFKDEKAATVVFGTLLIILVTITLVSGLALVASLTMKQNAERQAVLDAAKNENLKIVTIRPTASFDPSYWDSLNITVLNLDILDSNIAAISINGNFMMNYFLKDENGKLFLINGTSYPVVYNSSHKALIPAGKSSQICIGSIHTSESTPIYYTGSPSSVNLSNFPSKEYSNYKVFVRVYNSTTNYPLNGFGEGLPGEDFYVDENTSTLWMTNASISAGDYNVNYTTFLPGTLGYNELQTTDAITVEIISDRTNIFSKRFMPPEPIAEIQDLGGGKYLLDASKSNAPDGFITSYKWTIYDATNNIMGNLTGIKVTNNTSNVNIDLTVTNNYGMISKLSDVGRAGKISI